MPSPNSAIQSQLDQLKRHLLSAQLRADDSNNVSLAHKLTELGQLAISLRNQVQLAHYGEDHYVPYVCHPAGD